MFRRTWMVAIVLLMVVSMLLAACGGAAEPTPEPAPTEPPAAVEEPTATPEPVAEEPTATPEPAAEEPTEVPAEEPTEAPPEEAPSDMPQLVIWADNTRLPALQPLADRAASELGVELVLSEVGFGDIRDKMKLSGPAGEGPDIFVGAHDWLGELYTNDLVAPITQCGTEDEFFGPALDAFTYEGELVGIPNATENLAFLYNTEMVSEAPATWAEVMELAAELESAGTVTQGLAVFPNDAYHFYPIQTAYGGYIFGTDAEGGYNPEDVGLDSEGSVDALAYVDQGVKDGHLSPDVDWEAAHVLFETGDAAMILTGPWALPRFKENGIPYAIADIPDADAEGVPFLGVQGFMINNFSENKLLAEAFLCEFVATDDVMQAMYEVDPRTPAFLVTRERAAQEDPDVGAFAAAGINANPMPAIPAMNAVWGSWGDAITLVYNQASTPEEAATNAAEQVREAIAGQ